MYNLDNKVYRKNALQPTIHKYTVREILEEPSVISGEADTAVLFSQPNFYIVILIIGSSLLTLAQEEAEPFRLSDTLTSCSHRLSKIIANFCNNMYKIVKRDTSHIIDKLIPEDLHEHMKRERLKRWRRVRRQVASECCERPCTVGNILLYCPEDAKVLTENPDIFY